MDIYDTLKADHRKVIDLLDDLIAAEQSDPEQRRVLVQQITDELIPHARAEEAVLYNCIRDVGLGTDQISHAYREHMEAESLLRGLQVTDAVNVNWVNGAKKLKAALEHHIEEEEGTLFRLAKDLFLKPEAEAMADVFNKMKPLIKEQSFIGQSVDMAVNLMPPRLRESFSKFARLPIAS